MMAIETTDLCRRFSRNEGLRHASLRVPKGSALALIGANGAGKTTLLRILVNILRPTSGSARVLDKDSRTLSAPDFNRIGYVAENQKLPERLSVERFFAYLRRLYPAWDGTLEESLRSGFDLPRSRHLAKLSHGMRMKVMLTGALAFRPELLILDEPLTGLDPLTRDEVIDGLIGQAHDTTIVISSHEMSEVEGLATHVAYMDRGRLVFQEPTHDLLARFRHVTVTFRSLPPSIEQMPTSWLFEGASGRTLQFIEREFIGEEALKKTISESLGEVEHLGADRMSLREVSKALMTGSRREQAS
jgi:ABC-2 type transport system ATP-binding protein